MKLTRMLFGWALATAVAITFGACAASPGSGATDAPEPTPSASIFPMPDLGPSPAPAAITEDEIEQLRLRSVEDEWTRVLERFPGAVRPETQFAGYITGDARLTAMRKCLESHNVPISEARSGPEPDAPLVSVSPNAQTQDESIGGFLCNTMLPYQPMTPPTDAQLGYIYDYLTKFIVPCYQANGVAITNTAAPPTRDYFVANWPNQNWFPSPDIPMMDSPEWDAINEACPPTK